MKIPRNLSGAAAAKLLSRRYGYSIVRNSMEFPRLKCVKGCLAKKRTAKSMRVIAIDPAPGKESTVFEGTEYLQLSAQELREYMNQITNAKGSILVCWDAPLTGPFGPASAGSYRFDFTKRPIERFFSLDDLMVESVAAKLPSSSGVS